MRQLSILTLTLFLFFTSCTHAQKERVGSPYRVVDSLLFVDVDTSYPFINYKDNKLIFCGDSTPMSRFSTKWHRVLSSGEGNVVIMQIGASHVQGGTFPHQIRRNLLLGARRSLKDSHVEGDFPMASRGMVFPYSAAVKCNNPFDYKVSRSYPLFLTRNVYKEPVEQLGLAGIAVTASDSVAEIGITLVDPDLKFSTTEVTLLGESRGGVIPMLKAGNLDSLLFPFVTDAPARRYHYRLPSPTDSLQIILPCDSGQSFALTGVLLGNNAPGITYHSIGVNGASVGDYLTKCPYLTTDLRMCPPDLVIFGIGINDAAGPNFDTAVFRQRYLRLVDSIRSISPDCAFIFITNNDSYKRVKRRYSVNNNGPLVREAFMRIAAQCNGMVWDQFSIMGGLTSMKTWTENSLGQKDRVHFTRAGYQLLGDLFSNAFFNALIQTKPKPPQIKFSAAPSDADSTGRDSTGVNQQPDDSLKKPTQNSKRQTPRVYRKPADRKKSQSDNEGPLYISY